MPTFKQLPLKSVEVLKNWVEKHESDPKALVAAAGLTATQVLGLKFCNYAILYQNFLDLLTLNPIYYLKPRKFDHEPYIIIIFIT